MFGSIRNPCRFIQVYESYDYTDAIISYAYDDTEALVQVSD